MKMYQISTMKTSRLQECVKIFYASVKALSPLNTGDHSVCSIKNGDPIHEVSCVGYTPSHGIHVLYTSY